MVTGIKKTFKPRVLSAQLVDVDVDVGLSAQGSRSLENTDQPIEPAQHGDAMFTIEDVDEDMKRMMWLTPDWSL